ncbi:MAG: FAD-dependent oxidoreductase [Ignavibacteriae bacterium]|nr:FAD-dependent oxidoreductase [Ignavibacteriota bacterium]
MPDSRPRLVILGTGFGAFNLIKHLRDDYNVTVVSPRNHFLFTPLLPSTTVGTIEFRSIIEPIRHARRDIRFYHASAHDVDTERRITSCMGVAQPDEFEVEYDILVVAVGAVSNTFDVPGVAEYALFLKELHDARELRQRIIQCFERANLPSLSIEERQRLVHFVVCGGGPTGVEFAAELHDFMVEDLRKSYPQLVTQAKITLVEATKEILNTFDDKLRRYATDLFRRQRINVLTEAPVVKVGKEIIHLGDGSEIPYGLLLWSTGNGPTPFVERIKLPKDERSRIIVDKYFRVKGLESIYALGDCSVVEGAPLPATSQVAQQEGKYLARSLTKRARKKSVEPFHYKHLGMLAYIGSNKALADLQNFKGRGWTTWLFWRSAYLSRIVSIKNKVLVVFDWVKAKVFGRDISQF